MALQIIISSVCLLLAAGCKALSDSIAHGKCKWTNKNKPMSFFGEKSDLRKYRFPLEEPSNTWYSKFAVIRYKEKFPFSATLFVAFTDAWHFSNSLMTTFIVLAVAIQTPWPVMFFIAVRLAWGIVFSIGYRFVSR